MCQRLNFWIIRCGGTALANPPILSGVEAPAKATVVLTATAFTFTLASIPSSVSNLKLVIQASAPQSGGISNAFAKASSFSEPMSVVSTAISIVSELLVLAGAILGVKTTYDAKFIKLESDLQRKADKPSSQSCKSDKSDQPDQSADDE